MEVGVSTACFFPMLTERALDVLLELGVKTVEVFLNSPSEAGPAFTRRLRRAADAAGARIVSVHPWSAAYEGFSFFGRYERRFEDGVEEYKRTFEACGAMGADIVAFHGARSQFPVAPGLYAERFGRLAEVGRSFGVRLCHENVVNFYMESVEAVRCLRRELPDIDLLFDVKQALRARADPLEMIDAMGTGLRHVHISDHDDTRDCLPPGEGEADLAGLVGRLEGMGYGGALVVEVYSGSFTSAQQLQIGEKYLQEILQKR